MWKLQKRQKTRRTKEEEGKWEIDGESGRLGESLGASAYLSQADDDGDESLVKLHNRPLSPLRSNSFLFTKQVTLTFISVGR